MNNEKEEQRYGRNKSTLVDKSYISGGEYRRKFDKITDDNELSRLLYYKPDTDDMRKSPAITILKELTAARAKINAYDPKAEREAKECYLKGNENITYCESKYEALKDADALILITEWKEFRSPDFYEIKRLLAQPVIFDGRNQYDAKRVAEYGLEYYQIGVRPLEITSEA